MGLTDRNQIPIIDKRMDGFGGSFLLISNTQEFINRVRSAAAEVHCDLAYEPVRYYDDATHSGPTGLFRKPQSYAYQSEFRLALTSGRCGSIDLQCGSMHDIATMVMPSTTFNDLVTIAHS